MLKKIKGNERERKREGRRERKREWTGTRRSHQGSRERQTDRQAGRLTDVVWVWFSQGGERRPF